VPWASNRSAPAAASNPAIAPPMPPDAPVTSATLPANGNALSDMFFPLPVDAASLVGAWLLRHFAWMQIRQFISPNLRMDFCPMSVISAFRDARGRPRHHASLRLFSRHSCARFDAISPCRRLIQTSHCGRSGGTDSHPLAIQHSAPRIGIRPPTRSQACRLCMRTGSTNQLRPRSKVRSALKRYWRKGGASCMGR
jgi:hypothetical protein